MEIRVHLVVVLLFMVHRVTYAYKNVEDMNFIERNNDTKINNNNTNSNGTIVGRDNKTGNSSCNNNGSNKNNNNNHKRVTVNKPSKKVYDNVNKNNQLSTRLSSNKKHFGKRNVATTMRSTSLMSLDKTAVEERGPKRKRRQQMERTLMALLIAYKLKFIALVPTMMGGLFLLMATTALAGFFFALFAAVLGLKGH